MPAQTLTGLTDDFVAMKGGDVEKTYSTANGYADRFAEAREMAEPMVFLNSDLASFISGQILSVDFGKDADVLIGKIPDQMSFKLLG
jgi:NAD(P)-dependent dehydrogenase (short-subunit alcohol dehydrogenase family)